MNLPVVYIDDEPSLCRVFEMVLGARGMEIVTFTNPAAGLEYLNAHDVAVVFCDYRMPKMTGLEVLAQMTRKAPFYLVSGDLAADACASNPGITGLLAKPFRAEELIKLVNKHVVAESEPGQGAGPG